MKADIVVKSIIYNRKLGRILLVQRCNADDIGAGTWENAGGNVEQSETPELAMAREIYEETGLTEVRIERVAYVTLVNAEVPYLIIAYLCEALTENVTLSEEHQDFLWADEAECRRLLPKAIIDDFDNNGIFEHLR